MTLSIPSSSTSLIFSTDRIPPPNWIFKLVFFLMSNSTDPFSDLPSFAASKSTTCIQEHPSDSNILACATGSSLNMVFFE